LVKVGGLSEPRLVLCMNGTVGSNFTFLMKGTEKASNMPNLMNAMMELRKCCIHPYLIRGAEDVITKEVGATDAAQQYNCMIQASGKVRYLDGSGQTWWAKLAVLTGATNDLSAPGDLQLILLDKLLARLRQGGHKVLIFSQMTRCLDILQDYLRGRDYPYERIDGNVRSDLRQAAIDRFSRPVRAAVGGPARRQRPSCKRVHR